MHKFTAIAKSSSLALYQNVLEYNTPKFVHIKSKCIGIFYRLLQLLILAFICLYMIWYRRGYQQVGYVSSVTTSKVRGSSLTSLNSSFINTQHMWDSVDFVVPVKDSNTFFVTTSLFLTPNQTISNCSENTKYSHCNNNGDCSMGEMVYNGNGIMTGECDNVTHSCKIQAWCPVENEKENSRISLTNFLNYTVFIKNFIYFSAFEGATNPYAYRNVKNTDNPNIHIAPNCQFDAETAKHNASILFCPIFTLSTLLTDPYMVKSRKPMDIDNIRENGAVVELGIHWDCNLDYSIENCQLQYWTRRLDQPNSSFSKGYNFRNSEYVFENSKRYRYLYKLYGIKFNIVVSGIARKFDFYKLLVTIGSGVSYFAIASIVADYVILWFHKKRRMYRDKVYKAIREENIEQTYSTNEICEKLIDD